MKINFLKIDKWCILEDFKIEFDKDLSVIIGVNGSGKSTIIELIALIFGHLYKYYIEQDKTAEFVEGYTINFTSSITKNNKTYSYIVEIESIEHISETEDEGTFKHIIKINNKEYTLRNANIFLSEIGGFKALLPPSIVLYYAGITKRLEDLCNYFDDKYRKQITKSTSDYSIVPLNLPRERPFFYCKPQHLSVITLCLLVSQKELHKEIIDKYLNISQLNSTIIVDIKKPSWFKTSDSKTFWGASEGAIKEFLSILVSFSSRKDFKANKIRLEFDSIFPLVDFLATFKIENSELFLFKMLDLIMFNEFLANIDINWKNENDDIIELDRLSEGQKQLILTDGLAELWNVENSLILFDEPDTFLHPNWQAEFISNINKRSKGNQILITTHSPQLLSNFDNGELHIMSKGELVEHSGDFYGRDVNSILAHYMSSSYRPASIEKLIEEISSSISKKEFELAKKKLETLKKKVSDNDSEYIRLSTKLNFLAK